MKKNILNLLIILLLSFILLNILIFSKEVLESVLMGIKIWKENIFTSLFPFFIITDLLIKYGFVDLIGEVTKKIMNKFFYLPGETSFIIIASILCGFPSSAKYIKEFLDEKKINIDEAQYLLSFTHFSNPLFILGVIGQSILKNQKLGIIILISIILGNFIIAFFIREKKQIPKTEINIKKILQKISNNTKNNNLIDILSNSIFKTINTLVLLLGIITTFLILTTIISNLLDLDIFSKAIISGILEMTQGIKSMEYINIPIHIKASLITAFISFGGISIHLQIMSILNGTKVNYKYYLICRVIHCILSGTITLIISKLILNM